MNKSIRGRHHTFFVPLAAMAIFAFCVNVSSAYALRVALPVPSSGLVVTDSGGYRWDINQYGAIQYGTNNATFSSSQMMYINGSTFSPSQRSQNKKGDTFRVSGQINGVFVTRTVYINIKEKYARYVESFQNSGTNNLSISAMIRTQCNSRAGWIVTDAGRSLSGTLNKKEYGFIAGQTSTSRKAIVVCYGTKGGKIKPTVNNNNNYRIDATFQLSIPRGKTVSVMYTIAQRDLRSPPSGRALANVFKPLKSSKVKKGIPSKVSRTIVTHGGFSAAVGGLTSISESLGVEPTGDSDLLVIAESTVIKGKAECEKVVIKTDLGQAEFKLEQIAALTGTKFGQRLHRIYLRDGQVVIGELNLVGLKFRRLDNTAMPLTGKSLDRLVLKALKTDGKPAPSIGSFMDVLGGHRLGVSSTASLTFAFETPWGRVTVQRDDIAEMRYAESSQPGRVVLLKDGSRFFAFLRGAALKVKTTIFGEKDVHPAQIRALRDAQPRKSDDDDDDELEIKDASVSLSGENLVAGRIDAQVINLISAGTVIPFPPREIRRLINVSDEEGEAEFNGGTIFRAEGWSGDIVTGRIKEKVLPIRVNGQVVHVPTRDLIEATQPTPIVTDAERAEFAKAIRDLASVKWTVREEATRRLKLKALKAKRQLEQTLKQTRDEEVKKRIETILDGIEE